LATSTELFKDANDADRFRSRGWWRDETILDDLHRAAEHRPGHPAIVAHRDGTVRRLTYAELRALTDRFAGALLELGVHSGDIVTIEMPNWWQLPVLYLACARIGAVVNPVQPIMRSRELGFILERTGSRVCIVPDTWRGFSYAGMLAQLGETVPTLEHRVVIGDAAIPRSVDFDRHFVRTPWEDLHPAGELDRLAPAPDDVAQVMFTSGTTGEPKGAVHTHNTLFAAMRCEPHALGLSGDDVVHMGSPMTHQAGFLYCHFMPVHLGGTAVFQDVWDAGVMLDLVQSHGITLAMGATPFVLDAIAAQRARPRDLRSLRVFVCGGTSIPSHLVREAAEVLGAELVALWGMTENGGVTLTWAGDPPELVADSDGRTVPWMEARIVDDQGRPCEGSRVGRLLVRGASQCLGYFKRPDLYAASLDPDGWFDTGDLARSDGHGGIRIAGRSKDLIIRGGENVPVAEVESLLYRHPNVREVAVVAYPDERLGERACAVVAPAGGPPTLPDLQRHLEELGMARSFWPERLEIVDELPKTPSGKIQKFVLRQRLAET
jgi:cyclohexanecarboxylate-CoA ligase